MNQALDRRRIVGPDTSVRPLPLLSEEADTPFLVGRHDGRSDEQIRPIFLKRGLINQANGSAYIELEETKVVCAVYGPRQLKRLGINLQGNLHCEFKFAPFSCPKRRGYSTDFQEKESSLVLKQALARSVRLELIPKSTVDVFVTVIQNDGYSSCLAAAITAASVALADAGIELRDKVSATSAAYIKDRVLMDPTLKEESHQEASLLLAYMPSLNEVTHILQLGESETKSTLSTIGACIDASSKISTVMDECLKEE